MKSKFFQRIHYKSIIKVKGNIKQMDSKLDLKVINILKGKVSEERLQELIDYINNNHRLFVYSQIDDMLNRGEIDLTIEEKIILEQFWRENY